MTNSAASDCCRGGPSSAGVGRRGLVGYGERVRHRIRVQPSPVDKEFEISRVGVGLRCVGGTGAGVDSNNGKMKRGMRMADSGGEIKGGQKC